MKERIIISLLVVALVVALVISPAVLRADSHLLSGAMMVIILSLLCALKGN